MSREKLLNEILVLLGDAIELMDTSESSPEDPAVYLLITEAYERAEDELNQILCSRIA
jgi:hypothetical protein